MAIKNISTRMKICGRTEKCIGGHSAVEQSGYISREIMYSEYDCKTYYPKYAEDLVHNEVLLFQCLFYIKMAGYIRLHPAILDFWLITSVPILILFQKSRIYPADGA